MIKNFIKQFYDICFNCRRKRFGVKRREVPIPGTNLVAKSRERICADCHKKVLQEVAKGRKYD